MKEKLNVSALGDGALIAAIINGNRALFEIIIRRSNQRLYRIGMSILDNPADTEDAMQTTYVNAFSHLRDFEQHSSIETWMTRIMINECLGQKNKQKVRKNYLSAAAVNNTSMQTPDNHFFSKELHGALENAINRLPEKYRLVFVLRELEDLSVKDTGTLLHIKESNVKVRLNRAKSLLKQDLKEYAKENVYAYHLFRCDAMVSRVMTIIDPSSPH